MKVETPRANEYENANKYRPILEEPKHTKAFNALHTYSYTVSDGIR